MGETTKGGIRDIKQRAPHSETVLVDNLDNEVTLVDGVTFVDDDTLNVSRDGCGDGRLHLHRTQDCKCTVSYPAVFQNNQNIPQTGSPFLIS